VISILAKKGPMRAHDLLRELEVATGEPITLSALMDCLLKAEEEGFVERERRKNLNKHTPLSSSLWKVKVEPEQLTLPAQPAEEPTNLRIVVSQPVFAFSAVSELRSSLQLLEVREAVERVIMRAEKELRIMCPYYDDFFVHLLSTNMEKVKNLTEIRIIADEKGTTLKRVEHLFPNVRIKCLLGKVMGDRGELKVRGVHAKMLIADESESLVGSFNLTFRHSLYNFDIGFLVKGTVVRKLVKIFDHLWKL